jgi:hypothetical protein
MEHGRERQPYPYAGEAARPPQNAHFFYIAKPDTRFFHKRAHGREKIFLLLDAAARNTVNLFAAKQSDAQGSLRAVNRQNRR